jgi:hypothetical protein
MKHRNVDFAIVFFLLASALPANALTLYVSPSGNDSWSGRIAAPNREHTDGPLASLAGARDAIRSVKTAQAGPSAIHVVVENGVYAMTAPLVLEPRDSGAPTAPIVYEAAKGAHPAFIGGRIVSGLKRGPDGVWRVALPDVAAGKWTFQQLWIDGRRARQARFPSDGLLTAPRIDQDATSNSGQVATTLTVEKDRLNPLAPLTQAQIAGMRLVGFHTWDNLIHYVTGFDPAANTLTIQSEKLPPWYSPGSKTKFYLDNIPIALGAPGDWSLSADGVLSYRPLPGENVAAEQVVAPTVDKFIVIQGDPARSRFVESVVFQNLAFRYAQYVLPPEGFDPAQAASRIEAAVMVDGADRIRFENCEIAHIGTYAVWLRRGCGRITVRHCYLHDLGAGGVRIGEESIRPDGPERTGNCGVDNCIIDDGGRVFPCAVGIWIGQSGGNAITHNEIANLFYTGISVGWTWGYGDSLAVDNRIAYNDIHHIGWRLLSDMGAIYSLGISTGTTIDHNVIHDVYAAEYGGWGLYADEGSSGILYEDNLVYHNGSAGFHQHYGRENIVRNNIFAFDHEGEIRRTRVEDHVAFHLTGNIVDASEANILYELNAKSPGIELDRNLYWSTANTPPKFDSKSLADWQATGYDTGSIVADPEFVDPANRDFRLGPRSPALQLGFAPFDPREAGVHGDPAWLRLAKSLAMPPVDDTTTGPVKLP